MYTTVISPNTMPGSSLSHAYCASRTASVDAAWLSTPTNPSNLASLVVAFISGNLPSNLTVCKATLVPLNICGFCYVEVIRRLCKRVRDFKERQQIWGFSVLSQFAIRELPLILILINFLFLRTTAIGLLRCSASKFGWYWESL